MIALFLLAYDFSVKSEGNLHKNILNTSRKKFNTNKRSELFNENDEKIT